MNTRIPGKKFVKHRQQINKEDINNKGYPHAQKVQKAFERKNLAEYHGSHVQSDKLLLADVFENFRDVCIDIYELVPARFLSVACLA